MIKVKGFTLLQLLIVFFITGVLFSLATPTFLQLFSENRLATVQNKLNASIALTRSEAIKRGHRVTLCQSDDGRNCTKASHHWHQGWVIFTDLNHNNQVDNTESILLVQQLIPDLTLSFGDRTRIAFHPIGFAVGGSNGTFVLCNISNRTTKTGLILSASGRTRVAQPHDLMNRPC